MVSSHPSFCFHRFSSFCFFFSLLSVFLLLFLLFDSTHPSQLALVMAKRLASNWSKRQPSAGKRMKMSSMTLQVGLLSSLVQSAGSQSSCLPPHFCAVIVVHLHIRPSAPPGSEAAPSAPAVSSAEASSAVAGYSSLPVDAAAPAEAAESRCWCPYGFRCYSCCPSDSCIYIGSQCCGRSFCLKASWSLIDPFRCSHSVSLDD